MKAPERQPARQVRGPRCIHGLARGVFVRSTTLSTVSRGERAATLGLL